ncbi:MurR/RpiR family transcriptional regulator [Synergistaceae bacterium OttesenSCG-928-I11]|nr:MurR/RpiR family transcriptional regulator [Synergistaceae bacterium OttesenSCG-928-I11]
MIWEKMELELERLPRAQKKVARYMVDNPSESLFMTSQQLGANSETSEATVIRLATTLGFAGFPEFKQALQDEAKDSLSTFGRLQRHMSTVRTGNLLSDVIAAEIDKASACLQQTDDNRIRALAGEICRAAGGVYIVGLRSARSLAVYMQFYLSWFLPNVYVPENDSLETYLVSAPKNSLLIGISFPRYTRLTLDCIRLAKRIGLKTAAITDSDASPLAAEADLSVTVPCVHVAHIDSLMIPFGMANALLIEVTSQLGPRALERLGELEKIWSSGSTYC